jgi:preprotein translocase subunit SecA
MPIATCTFRVFVSSTFEDLKVERDALQGELWPKLRTLIALGRASRAFPRCGSTDLLELAPKGSDLYRWVLGYGAGKSSPGSVGKNKVGRNDPCPCGSGKKFKKCCGS